MSWPTRTWTHDGWKDFKPPLEGRTPKGLPDDWEDHKVGGDSMTYWDVLDNPLYEAAAEASGIDWNKWVKDSMDDIGKEDDYSDDHGGSKYTTDYAGWRSALNDWENDEDAGRDEKPDINDFMKPGGTIRRSKKGGGFYEQDFNPSSGSAHELAWRFGNVRNKEELLEDAMKWGISRGKHGNFIEDLDEMRGWLKETIKVFNMQDSPIIRRGPDGSDYGIDGDIWAFYGLDEEPAAPKEMDVHYAYNLTPMQSSNVRYETPEGYPVLDLGHNNQAGASSG